MSSPHTITLSVSGMTCASCVARVEKALNAAPGVRAASVNLASETARVDLDDQAGVARVVEVLEGAGYPARTASAVFDVTDMHCASCVGRVQKSLLAMSGVISAEVNLAAETASVRYLQGALTPESIAAAITAAGYPARVRGAGGPDDGGGAGGSGSKGEAGPEGGTGATGGVPDLATRKAAESHRLRRATLIAAALTLPVFVLEMGGHMIPAFHDWIGATLGHQTSWILQFVLATLVLAWPGRQFYRLGYRALFRLAPDMNSLVALGTSAAWGYSVVATFAPGLLPESGRAVYFEAASVIVVLILLGRYLEAGARGRAGAAISGLLGLRPKSARVLRDGAFVEEPIAEIVPGDILQLRPGERVAVDGEVTDGSTWIDESMITGEPDPIRKEAGADVVAGTVNGTGTVSYRATRVGADTMLAQIIRMVEEAQGAKLPIQGLVDRITLWFVPAVLGVAVVTVAAWLVFGPEPRLTHALVAGVSVLIIACPCAMGLATPTSIMVGTGRAAEMGVLFRQGDALQALTGAQVVAVDKTGTLTEGRPALTDLVLADGFARAEVLAAVAAVENASEHPIATAIVRAAEGEGLTPGSATDFDSITGHGVAATVAGRRVLVGADRLLAREGIDLGTLAQAGERLGLDGKTPVYAAIDGRAAAVIAVADPIRHGTKAAIDALHAQGLTVAMITGDNAGTANAIARRLGIEDVVAEVAPEGKVTALERLRAGGRRIAFVGDGINDAPALAHADVGIAIGTGTDVAIESADVVLMSGDLRGVVNAFGISAHTMRNIRQNLAWAFTYNVLLIPVAAGVLYPALGILLSPALAAGAMALSSVFVVTNALRLRRVRAYLPETAPRGPRGAAAALPRKEAVA